MVLPVAQVVKNLPVIQQIRFQSLSWANPLEKGMATHYRVLAWRIPRTKEPGSLQSMRSQRVNTAEQLTLKVSPVTQR